MSDTLSKIRNDMSNYNIYNPEKIKVYESKPIVENKFVSDLVEKIPIQRETIPYVISPVIGGVLTGVLFGFKKELFYTKAEKEGDKDTLNKTRLGMSFLFFTLVGYTAVNRTGVF